MSSEYRFAVGDPNGARSCSWRFAAKGAGAYLLQRNREQSARLDLAANGSCRWVTVAGLKSGADRTIVAWKRPPDAANAPAVLLSALRFPGGHLSTVYEGIKGAVTWLPAPPTGEALVVEVLYVGAQGPGARQALEDGRRTILFALGFGNGGTVCLASRREQTGPVEMRIEREVMVPGQRASTLIFPEIDSAGTGRPIRLAAVTQGSQPPQVWEVGGFEVKAAGQPIG